MAVSQENINRWIDQSNIDYIGYFIKAWIPFNAWYNNSYPHLSQERQKISAVKNDPNTIRNGIHSYMETANIQGEEFRSYLSSLYHQLNQTNIEGRDGRITMDISLNHRNPTDTINNQDVGHNRYYLLRTDGQRMGQVTAMHVVIKRRSNNATIFNYSHTTYDQDHFLGHPDFVVLSPQRREQARLFFQDLVPIKSDSLIENNRQENPLNYYKCDAYNFRRDIGFPDCYSIHVCKSLIETLYLLRNVLFHGELVPNNDAQKAYKEAYLLLHMLLQKLR